MNAQDPGFAEAIAAELRAELARQNHSRRWLAEQVDHSHVTVSRWLTDGHMPLSALFELCAALGISAGALIGRFEHRDAQVLPHPRRRSTDSFRRAA